MTWTAKLVPDDRPAWGLGEVLRLSWPAGLSMLNANVMRFIDGLMVSKLGYDTMSAQFFAGMTAFVPESLATGLLTVVNTFVSQNLGAGRHSRCGQYAWAGIFLALAFSLLVAPMAFFARPIFSIFGHVEPIRQMETMYFRYMVVSVFFTLTSRPIEQFFYGIHRPGLVLGASIVANAFNVVGDYALIFGKFGLPAMGLRGAAIATVASWGLLFGILLAVFLSRSMHRRYATRNFRDAGAEQIMGVLRIGWPAGVQFINDMLPWIIFIGVIVGRFGTTHLAASTAAMRWMPLSFMPAVGIGIAATALVGRYIGQGRFDLARKRAHAALLTAMVYMGMCGLAFWLLGRPMVRLFISVAGEQVGAVDQSHVEEIVRIGGYVMICAAVFQLFDAVGIVYIGALRGAGDTLWPMMLTAGLSWLVTVGGGLALAELLPSWGSIGPWVAASAYVIILGIVVAWRFESGAWERINLLGPRGSKPETPVKTPLPVPGILPTQNNADSQGQPPAAGQ